MKYRPPAVAGTFYPETQAQLHSTMTQMFSDLDTAKPRPKALIVPHAGYIYSGKVAAHAYRYIKDLPEQIERVALLGPSHRCQLKGCAVPSFDYFMTPLGNIAIDSKSCAKLIDSGLAQKLDQAHEEEHSLEVQLPFLQHCLKDFKLVPITVGQCQPDDVAKVIEVFAEEPNTLIVISTDLSHFLPYKQAAELDTKTINRIENCDATLAPEDACGCHAVNGMLHYSRQHNWQPQLVYRANSGDVNHAKQEVVGYASFIVD